MFHNIYEFPSNTLLTKLLHFQRESGDFYLRRQRSSLYWLLNLHIDRLFFFLHKERNFFMYNLCQTYKKARIFKHLSCLFIKLLRTQQLIKLCKFMRESLDATNKSLTLFSNFIVITYLNCACLSSVLAFVYVLLYILYSCVLLAILSASYEVTVISICLYPDLLLLDGCAFMLQTSECQLTFWWVILWSWGMNETADANHTTSTTSVLVQTQTQSVQFWVVSAVLGGMLTDATL